MTVKELKEFLSGVDDDSLICWTNDSYETMVFSIDSVELRDTLDEDEQKIVVLKS